VARNKGKQDHDEKRDELAAAARQLFVDLGYDATSMNGIAKSAGVATNTIYWYFRDKDAVLLAVLNDVLSDAAAEYTEIADRPVSELVAWLVETLERSSLLVTAVHSRISHSEELNAWHDRFHQTTEAAFRQALVRDGVPSEMLDSEIKIGVFTIEGLLTHEMSGAEKRAICESLTSRWAPLAPAPATIGAPSSS